MPMRSRPADRAKPAQEDCGPQLKQLYPALFSNPPKPLKLRIQADIQARSPGMFTKPQLSAFLRRYTGSHGYLNAIVKATHRFDLDGNPGDELSDEHRAAATEELARRRANTQARIALENEQRANRATLLKEFEANTLPVAEFAAAKGVPEGELEPLIARARKEALEPPPAPAFNRDRRGPQHNRGPRPDGQGPRNARPPRDANAAAGRCRRQRAAGRRAACAAAAAFGCAACPRTAPHARPRPRTDRPQGPRTDAPRTDRPQGPRTDAPRTDRPQGPRADGPRGPRPDGQPRPACGRPARPEQRPALRRTARPAPRRRPPRPAPGRRAFAASQRRLVAVGTHRDGAGVQRAAWPQDQAATPTGPRPARSACQDRSYRRSSASRAGRDGAQPASAWHSKPGPSPTPTTVLVGIARSVS